MARKAFFIIWTLVSVAVGLAFLVLTINVLGGDTPKDPGWHVAPSTGSTPSFAKGVKGVPSEVSEGVWEVGSADVSAGTYRVVHTLAKDSMCYWQVSTDPEGAHIVSNGIETGGTPQVTLKKGQWFKTSGCGPWKRR